MRCSTIQCFTGQIPGEYIVAQGTPEEVAQVEGSYTGQFLERVLGDVARYGQTTYAVLMREPVALHSG
jgi:hypothetical protein